MQTDAEVPIRAVVFDLWLTIIPFPPEVRRGTFQRTAEVLGFKPDELRPHWAASRVERETTELRGFLRSLGRELSADWDEATIEAAVAARARSHASCFANPYPDGRDAIKALRDRGVATGLVSNCSSDVRSALVEHGMDRWFDHVVLSAEVGVMKPAPQIYSLAAEALGVAPAECLYVGDGSDNELEGAASIGMTPVLYDRSGTASLPDVAAVSSHLELLAYVDR